MTFTHIDTGAVAAIRAAMRETGCQSHTTETYQDDVLAVLDAAGQGPGDVIEVGCYYGGLTVQLAHACAALGRRLHVVDINLTYLRTTLENLERLGLGANVAIFTGPLGVYLDGFRPITPPLAVVIDGDHTYEGVKADILAIRGMRPGPRHLIFHDYSLRYVQPELQSVRVDDAIRDHLGDAAPVLPFGALAEVGGPLRTVPGEDGHYHIEGRREGAHVQLC